MAARGQNQPRGGERLERGKEALQRGGVRPGPKPASRIAKSTPRRPVAAGGRAGESGGVPPLQTSNRPEPDAHFRRIIDRRSSGGDYPQSDDLTTNPVAAQPRSAEMRCEPSAAAPGSIEQLLQDARDGSREALGKLLNAFRG